MLKEHESLPIGEKPMDSGGGEKEERRELRRNEKAAGVLWAAINFSPNSDAPIIIERQNYPCNVQNQLYSALSTKSELSRLKIT
jgi:hypothetical protein